MVVGILARYIRIVQVMQMHYKTSDTFANSIRLYCVAVGKLNVMDKAQNVFMNSEPIHFLSSYTSAIIFLFTTP